MSWDWEGNGEFVPEEKICHALYSKYWTLIVPASVGDGDASRVIRSK